GAVLLSGGLRSVALCLLSSRIRAACSSDGLSKASVAARSRTGLKAEFISFTPSTAPQRLNGRQWYIPSIRSNAAAASRTLSLMHCQRLAPIGFDGSDQVVLDLPLDRFEPLAPHDLRAFGGALPLPEAALSDPLPPLAGRIPCAP